MVKFQYISDIHLEFKALSFVKGFFKWNYHKHEDCENLFLLGDIGNPKSDIYCEFLNECVSRWKNVFVIFGNHEYYGNDMETVGNSLNKNVHFLQNTSVYLDLNNGNVSNVKSKDCIKIIGTTLWSDIQLDAVFDINDYDMIKIKNKPLTPKITRNLFKISKEYILKELDSDTKTPTILLTHHGVDSICNGPFMGNYLQSAYATDIPELKKYKHLLACINGHTHVSIDTVIPDTNIKLLANCYGHDCDDKEIVKYNKKAILEVA